MEKINITIAGAGVIGLAIAAELSKVHQDILVLEKNPSFGQETSSRNSEVIHAGIYYPKDSLKAKTCVQGRQLLYEFCAKNSIPHKKIGKLIVAINDKEVLELNSLFKQGFANGAEELKLIPKGEIKKLEPYVQAQAAIYSPSTGILDTHVFMKSLAQQFEDRTGLIAYNTELVGIDKKKGGFEVAVDDKSEGVFKFFTRTLINCAGLNSDKIATLAGLRKEEYKLKYCKGDYFRVHNNKARFISRLVYPVPAKEHISLGIHAALDLAGGLRLGPDNEYVEKIGYTIDAAKQEKFYESVRPFLPFIELKDLTPDTCGIRPKLQGPGEDFRDFIIKDETDNGLTGFINLIGIESPGLTSCLSISRLIKDMAGKILNKT